MSVSIKNISLYIPHIFANFSKTDVAKVFEDQTIGKVKNIDFISKMDKDSKPYNAAYIHFDYWFDTLVAKHFQERVIDPRKEARIMYDDPWFWIVLENKSTKVITGERKKCIDIGDLNERKITSFQESEDATSAIVKEEEVDFIEEQAHIEMMDEMAECEMAMEEEEQYLIHIDGRYVQTLEQENIYLKNMLAQIQNAYYTETIKSQGLAQAIQLANLKNEIKNENETK